jgi:hypothetical protein
VSPITLIEEFKSMRSTVLAELTSDRKIRLRSTDGRDFQIIAATGDFEPTEGRMRFVAAVPPPAEPRARTVNEQVASIGRVINKHIETVSNTLRTTASTHNVESTAIYNLDYSLSAARTWDGWPGNVDSARSTRNTLSDILTSYDSLVSRVEDRLGSVQALQRDYGEFATDLRSFAAEMLDSYLTWDQARTMASSIQNKLSDRTATMTSEQARDLLLLLG